MASAASNGWALPDFKKPAEISEMVWESGEGALAKNSAVAKMAVDFISLHPCIIYKNKRLLPVSASGITQKSFLNFQPVPQLYSEFVFTCQPRGFGVHIRQCSGLWCYAACICLPADQDVLNGSKKAI